MDDDALVKRSPAAQASGSAMRQLLSYAIDGLGPLPSAKVSAGKVLAKVGIPDDAIELTVRNHLVLAGAQGFVTNLGGFATLAVFLPSNIAAVAMIKLHLVASIAHLRGYDLDDDRVRTAIMLCLLTTHGEVPDEIPTSVLAVATAPVANPALDTLIAERTMAQIATSIGGRRAITLVGRGIPLIGGAIGAGMDTWSVHQLASQARTHFVDRRPHVG